jgi:hypothetical protein
MFASLVVVAAPSLSPSSELRVSNLRSGLACTRSTPEKERTGWICQPTELILVTDQGTCVYDGQKELCTWHGFEFDYSTEKPGAKLQCVVRSSDPTDKGNPEKVQAENTTSGSFELELPKTNGHIYNPQYYLFKTRAAGDSDLIEETVCSHQGVVAFRVRFQFHFPALPLAN